MCVRRWLKSCLSVCLCVCFSVYLGDSVCGCLFQCMFLSQLKQTTMFIRLHHVNQSLGKWQLQNKQKFQNKNTFSCQMFRLQPVSSECLHSNDCDTFCTLFTLFILLLVVGYTTSSSYSLLSQRFGYGTLQPTTGIMMEF